MLTHILLAFGPRFTADRSEIVGYFIILHHFNRPHCKMMCICKYEKMSSLSMFVCAGVYCDIMYECEVR